MQVRGLPEEGQRIIHETRERTPWKYPLDYVAAPINKKLMPPTTKKPTPGKPLSLSWGECKTRGEYPHNEQTLCCNKRVRLHDIVVIVPVLSATNEVLGHTLLHVGCLRSFLLGVPQDYDAVKDAVAAIKDRFVDE